MKRKDKAQEIQRNKKYTSEMLLKIEEGGTKMTALSKQCGIPSSLLYRMRDGKKPASLHNAAVLQNTVGADQFSIEGSHPDAFAVLKNLSIFRQGTSKEAQDDASKTSKSSSDRSTGGRCGGKLKIDGSRAADIAQQAA